MHEAADIIASEARGMSLSYWARVKGEAVAVFDRFGEHSFAEINARANQITRLLRQAGLGPGEHVALACGRRAETVEILAACLRGGYRLIPLDYRLSAEEAAYVIDDADARAVFVESGLAQVFEGARRCSGLGLRIAVGGGADSFEVLDAALTGLADHDIDDPILGSTMFYTAGTTGRPKGVYRQSLKLVASELLGQYDAQTDVQLCVGPLHRGGLTLDVRCAMTMGLPVVFLDQWHALQVLETIQNRRVTHAQFSPLMFQRLLALPHTVRGGYDRSSLKRVVHGGAPCPREVKWMMIAWWGPILHEYYTGAENSAGVWIRPDEWMEKPGSVGRRPDRLGLKILDDEGRDCGVRGRGRIFFKRSPDNGFRYYKDPAGTEAVCCGDYYTLGDVGYVDQDDYLFVTGRSSDRIHACGADIDPQEIDEVLLGHPAVVDVACIGTPSASRGEEVRAVVQLGRGITGDRRLADELIAHARRRLASNKVPCAVEFVDALPRNAAEKLERIKLRETASPPRH